MDLLPVEDIFGVKTIIGDINDNEAEKEILNLLNARPNIVLSDMAANTIGHKKTDHIRTTQLTEIALEFAFKKFNDRRCFFSKNF